MPDRFEVKTVDLKKIKDEIQRIRELLGLPPLFLDDVHFSEELNAILSRTREQWYDQQTFLTKASTLFGARFPEFGEAPQLDPEAPTGIAPPEEVPAGIQEPTDDDELRRLMGLDIERFEESKRQFELQQGFRNRQFGLEQQKFAQNLIAGERTRQESLANLQAAQAGREQQRLASYTTTPPDFAAQMAELRRAKDYSDFELERRKMIDVLEGKPRQFIKLHQAQVAQNPYSRQPEGGSALDRLASTRSRTADQIRTVGAYIRRSPEGIDIEQAKMTQEALKEQLAKRTKEFKTLLKEGDVTWGGGRQEFRPELPPVPGGIQEFLPFGLKGEVTPPSGQAFNRLLFTPREQLFGALEFQGGTEEDLRQQIRSQLPQRALGIGSRTTPFAQRA